MLSERKINQLAEARKHIQHKPLSEETKQKISKANNGNFYAICDYCGRKFHTKKSAFAKRKHHFCCRECYSKYRAEIMPPEEQNAYGTGNDYAERLRRKRQEKFLIIICVTIILAESHAKFAERKNQKRTTMIMTNLLKFVGFVSNVIENGIKFTATLNRPKVVLKNEYLKR